MTNADIGILLFYIVGALILNAIVLLVLLARKQRRHDHKKHEV